MAGWRGHLAFAFIVLLIFTFLVWYFNVRVYLDLVHVAVGVVAFGLYTLIPDIDCKSSNIRKAVLIAMLGVVAFFLLLYLLFNEVLWFLAALLIVFLLIALLLSKHRGLLHSPFTAFFFSLPLVFFSPLVAVMAFGGFFLHLLLDGTLFKKS